jgi:hypothetical protein
MPYQPDPHLVRECARRIIEGQFEEIRDLGQMDIGEMCAEEIVAIQEPLGGWDAPGADKAADALINAVRADIKAAVISHAWPEATVDTGDPVDITAVRSLLVERANEYLGHRMPFFKVMNKEARIEDVEAGASWAYEGLVTAGVYMHALAFVIRVAGEDDPALAQKLAQIAEAVMDCGMDVLDEANADLPEPVAAEAVAQ